jgi:hypothetical protein
MMLFELGMNINKEVMMKRTHHLQIARYFKGMDSWANHIFASLSQVKRWRYSIQQIVDFEYAVLITKASAGKFTLPYIYAQCEEKPINEAIQFIDPMIKRYFKENRFLHEIQVGDRNQYLPQSLIWEIKQLYHIEQPIICTTDLHLVVGWHQYHQKKQSHSETIRVEYLPSLNDPNAIEDLMNQNNFWWSFKLSIFQRVLIGLYVEKTLQEHAGKQPCNAVSLRWQSLLQQREKIASTIACFETIKRYQRAKFIYKSGDIDLLLAVEKGKLSSIKAVKMIKKKKTVVLNIA